MEEALRNHLISDVALIEEIARYILDQKGKRIRPAFLIGVYKSFVTDKPLPKEGIDMACVLEMVHTASLLHDDVIDHADLRRNKKTAHTVWGNEAAVLVGDYLVALAFLILCRVADKDSIELVTRSSLNITKGEVMQLTQKYDSVAEKDYLQIIRWKTASLIAVAFVLGGKLAGLETKTQDLYSVGEDLGMAYQIVDDVFDYDPALQETGKKRGIDLQERKITLPLSHLFAVASAAEQDQLSTILAKPTIEESDFLQVQKMMVAKKSLEYSLDKAKFYLAEAERKLQALTPAEPKLLSLLMRFVVLRQS